MKKEKFAVYMRRLAFHEIRKSIFKKIINLGFPTALQMLFEVGLFTASVLLAGTLGAFPQAANQIALKLASTTFMIAVGIGVAATVRVGNQKGLKNFHELRRIAFSNFFLVRIGISLILPIALNRIPFSLKVSKFIFKKFFSKPINPNISSFGRFQFSVLNA